jgi:enamine deaminase RidA (YjgF/YER057c/UK114 family)
MSVSRMLVSSGSDFESAVGCSRAVRVGPHVAVAGTTGPGVLDDVGAQTREVLRRIEIVLTQARAALRDVVRTRSYVTDISRWREVAAVRGRRPRRARSWWVEIEADAYSPDEPAAGGKVPSADGR